jgi:hypothetical protein
MISVDLQGPVALTKKKVQSVTVFSLRSHREKREHLAIHPERKPGKNPKTWRPRLISGHFPEKTET